LAHPCIVAHVVDGAETDRPVNAEPKGRIIEAMSLHPAVTSPRQPAGAVVARGAWTDVHGLTAEDFAAAPLSAPRPQFLDELAAAAELLGR
jgi:hypothetical protein